MTRSPSSRRSTARSVIVVGAGVMRAAVAFHFAERGAEVTVIDDGRAGHPAERVTMADTQQLEPELRFGDDCDEISSIPTRRRYGPGMFVARMLDGAVVSTRFFLSSCLWNPRHAQPW